jgi:CBS domain containing-hemolysin-like protein
MSILPAVLFFLGAFLFSGLEAAWLAMDRVRLRHRADRGHVRARQMMAWEAMRPRADLMLAWTSHALGAASLVAWLAAFPPDRGFWWWAAPAIFVPLYALLVQVVARQVFRRLPFSVLNHTWWLVRLAGSLWLVPARLVARFLRMLPADPLPRPAPGPELLEVAENAEGISPLEMTMLRSVLGFRQLTARELTRPVRSFASVGADLTLAEILATRPVADARQIVVIGADGEPLGAMSVATAALSGAMGARAQSFARPLLVFSSELPSWKVLVQLRRAPTPVAEVRDEQTGRLVGLVTEESVVARLLGQEV